MNTCACVCALLMASCFGFVRPIVFSCDMFGIALVTVVMSSSLKHTLMDNITLNASELLEHFGGVNQNMLENLTDAYEHDENEINTIHHSPYYSI